MNKNTTICIKKMRNFKNYTQEKPNKIKSFLGLSLGLGQRQNQAMLK